MTSVKIKFRPSTKDKEKGKLFFQVIHKRVVRLITTAHCVSKKEWESVASSVAGCEHRLLWRIITNFAKTGEPYSVDNIVNEYNRLCTKQTLSTFMKAIIAQLQQDNQHCTARNYQSALNSFMHFRGKVDIPLEAFDAMLVKSYEAWLKRHGVSRNTSSFYMRILRAVYNRAAEQNIVLQQHPFSHVYTGVDKTRKRAVDLGVIKALKQMDLTDQPSAGFARDMFLLSFCLRGISFVDMAKLRKKDIRGGFLYYTRSKTQQTLCIKWEPIMQEIVDRHNKQNESSEYLLPILSAADVYNKVYHSTQVRIGYHLKRIAEVLGLKDNLTLYVARHSWASVARNSNIPISVISEALGHDSESTTQIYLQSIQSSEVDKANACILENL